MFALKALMASLGVVRSVDCRQDGDEARSEARPRELHLQSPRSPGIEEADAILIVGSNPRKEARS
jgi:NADH-quinone oxidoreductase subunit G